MAVLMGWLFWQEVYRHALPLAAPLDFQAVPRGSCIPLDELTPFQEKEQAMFVHFFDPNCPASRFTLPHFQQIVQQYHTRIAFVVIIPADISPAQVFPLLGHQMIVIQDTDQQWQKACGVYASPQAALISDTGSLYFRGNYSQTQLCTLVGENYAILSLDRLLSDKPAIDWGYQAHVPRGCQFTAPHPSPPVPFFSHLFAKR